MPPRLSDAAGSPAERRRSGRRAPWRVVPAGPGMFLAAHEETGRSYRLPVTDWAEAEAQVTMLNRASLTMDA